MKCSIKLQIQLKHNSKGLCVHACLRLTGMLTNPHKSDVIGQLTHNWLDLRFGVSGVRLELLLELPCCDESPRLLLLSNQAPPP